MMTEITPQYLASQGLSPTFPERFWTKVNKNGPVPKHRPELGPCWVWTGATNDGGYGQIIKRYGAGPILASRASWILHNGPIPEGKCILHKCDLPSCIRDTHLFPGTKKDNAVDRNSKGRHDPQIGSGNGHAKLTESDVLEIRRLRKETDLTLSQIGKLFGVSKEHVWTIIHRMRWTHI